MQCTEHRKIKNHVCIKDSGVQASEDYAAENSRILEMGLLDRFVHLIGTVKWVRFWMAAMS